MPLPLEVFGEFSYAPEMLSFRDTDDFLSYRFGVGVQVVPNASVRVECQYFDVDMEAGPRPWNLDDSVIRASLVMRF